MDWLEDRSLGWLVFGDIRGSLDGCPSVVRMDTYYLHDHHHHHDWEAAGCPSHEVYEYGVENWTLLRWRYYVD